MTEKIALLCALFPASEGKQKRILDLLRRNARDYYRQPKAKCTAWSYYTAYPPHSPNLMIGGLEIYTTKSALSDQIGDADFQAYHEKVKREGLYSKDEELVAFYPSAGFVAREVHALPFGGTLISLSRFICKDKAAVLNLIKNFVPYVRDEEPFVLSYAAFERKKNPKELMLFVRYMDAAGMNIHSKAPEHEQVVKNIMPLLENDFAKATNIWQEIEDSFVSTEVGGPANSAKL